MGRKKKIFKPFKETSPPITEVDLDLSKYDVIQQPNGQWDIKIFRLYGGGLKQCIVEFENTYGKIDGKIYHDEKAKLIGITGSNVLPNVERIVREFNEING